jgi:hypothetical protein
LNVPKNDNGTNANEVYPGYIPKEGLAGNETVTVTNTILKNGTYTAKLSEVNMKYDKFAYAGVI